MHSNPTIKGIKYEGKTYNIEIQINNSDAYITGTANDDEGRGPRTTMYYRHGEKVYLDDGKVIIGKKRFSPEFRGKGGSKTLTFVKDQDLEGQIN